MLTCSNMIKTITYNFARKLKSPAPPSSATSSTTISQSSLSIKSLKSNNMSIVQELQLQKRQGERLLEEAEKNQLMEEFQPFNSSTVQLHKEKARAAVFKQLSFRGEDPNPNKLVNRPAKGAVWGLGGQLILANRKVQLQGVRDDPEQITKFLELQQVKNIYIHDWSKLEDPSINRRRYSIIGSCFSSKHCWKVAIELKNAFNKHMLRLKRDKKTRKVDLITAVMNGGKDEEWTLVEYKDFEVSLMTEQQREAVDLEWKWNNPASQETADRHARMSMDKKKRKSQYGDFQ